MAVCAFSHSSLEPLSNKTPFGPVGSACTFQCVLAQILSMFRKVLFCLVTENVFGTDWDKLGT